MGSFGDLVVIGEVTNVGSTTIPGVRITMALANQEEKQIIGEKESLSLPWGQIGSRETAPFTVEFDVPPEPRTWDTENITAIVGSPAGVIGRVGNVVPTLTTENLEIEARTASGTIRNTGSRSVGNLEVAVTGYNDRGEVVAVWWPSFINGTLAPGYALDFQISSVFVSGQPLDATTYRARVLGVEQ